jgi:hypothetical protein
MTTKERDAIDALRAEVHSYHGIVLTHIAKCEPYFERTDRLNMDVYGNPADRDGSPGIIAQVGDLRKSRKIILGVAAGAWTIATILIGALVSHFV